VADEGPYRHARHKEQPEVVGDSVVVVERVARIHRRSKFETAENVYQAHTATIMCKVYTFDPSVHATWLDENASIAMGYLQRFSVNGSAFMGGGGKYTLAEIDVPANGAVAITAVPYDDTARAFAKAHNALLTTDTSKQTQELRARMWMKMVAGSVPGTFKYTHAELTGIFAGGVIYPAVVALRPGYTDDTHELHAPERHFDDLKRQSNTLLRVDPDKPIRFNRVDVPSLQTDLETAIAAGTDDSSVAAAIARVALAEVFDGGPPWGVVAAKGMLVLPFLIGPNGSFFAAESTCVFQENNRHTAYRATVAWVGASTAQSDLDLAVLDGAASTLFPNAVACSQTITVGVAPGVTVRTAWANRSVAPRPFHDLVARLLKTSAVSMYTDAVISIPQSSRALIKHLLNSDTVGIHHNNDVVWIALAVGGSVIVRSPSTSLPIPTDKCTLN
jgi:hypothetical protein